MTAKIFTVYTAITNNFDLPADSNILNFNGYSKFRDPRRNAKIYKALSNHYIHTPYNIWIDGNVKLNCDPEVLIEMMGDKEALVFSHPARDCIYDEAKICIQAKKDSADVINTQVGHYHDLGYPPHNGLASCRLIVRKNTEQIAQLNALWWAEICAGSVRDQISFPFIFRDLVKYIPHPASLDNEFFTVKKHRKSIRFLGGIRMPWQKHICGLHSAQK